MFEGIYLTSTKRRLLGSLALLMDKTSTLNQQFLVSRILTEIRQFKNQNKFKTLAAPIFHKNAMLRGRYSSTIDSQEASYSLIITDLKKTDGKHYLTRLKALNFLRGTSFSIDRSCESYTPLQSKKLKIFYIPFWSRIITCSFTVETEKRLR